MKTRIILTVGVILIFALFFLSCDTLIQIFGSDNNENGSVKSEEYSVYSVVLNSFQGDHSPYAVLSDSTEGWDISDQLDYIKEHIPELSDETILSYIARNEKSVKIAEIPNVEIQIDFISPNHGEEWHAWKDVYPEADVLIHFSRVGFNGRRDQAVVYESFFYAPLAGTGNIIFLQKEETWVIKKTVMVWIS